MAETSLLLELYYTSVKLTILTFCSPGERMTPLSQAIPFFVTRGCGTQLREGGRP